MASAVRHEPPLPVLTFDPAAREHRSVALMGSAARGRGALQRRILLAGLSAADRRRLEVFLGVDSDRLRQHWRLVTEAPVDLYLYDADEAPTVPGSLESTPHQVRVMDDRHAEPGDLSMLRRPLQYEPFIDILAAVEQQAPAPAKPAAAVGQAARFRLRRWPGASLLDAIPQGLRLASFITVRYLSLDELSSLSGVAPERCRSFLDTMREHDLLRAEPTPGSGAAAEVPAWARAAARPDRHLLASLRAKLGIPRGGR